MAARGAAAAAAARSAAMVGGSAAAPAAAARQSGASAAAAAAAASAQQGSRSAAAAAGRRGVKVNARSSEEYAEIMKQQKALRPSTYKDAIRSDKVELSEFEIPDAELKTAMNKWNDSMAKVFARQKAIKNEGLTAQQVAMQSRYNTVAKIAVAWAAVACIGANIQGYEKMKDNQVDR